MPDPTGIRYWLILAAAVLLILAGVARLILAYRRGGEPKTTLAGTLFVAAAIVWFLDGEPYLAGVWAVVGLINLANLPQQLADRWYER